MNKTWITAFLLFSSSIAADVTPSGQREIEHLLNFVQRSDCVIDRNGKSYGADAAISHIRKKYAYFEDEIETSEDFIELSATRSTMSGKDYLVRCGDAEQIRTQDWLLQELQNFRQQQRDGGAEVQ